MMDFSALLPAMLLPACFVGGLVVGHGYFHALRATTDLILHEGKPMMALVLTFGRMSLLATAFFMAVLAGGAALLATFTGVLCAKALMLYRVRLEKL